MEVFVGLRHRNGGNSSDVLHFPKVLVLSNRDWIESDEHLNLSVRNKSFNHKTIHWFKHELSLITISSIDKDLLRFIPPDLPKLTTIRIFRLVDSKSIICIGLIFHIYSNKVPACVTFGTSDGELVVLALGHFFVLVRVGWGVGDGGKNIVVIVFLTGSLVHNGRFSDWIYQSNLNVLMLPVIKLIHSRF
jgi:hypothetical protein